jgi:hypothetical protein
MRGNANSDSAVQVYRNDDGSFEIKQGNLRARIMLAARGSIEAVDQHGTAVTLIERGGGLVDATVAHIVALRH